MASNNGMRSAGSPALVLLLLFCSLVAHATGLSTSFADIQVSDVPLGQAYDLGEQNEQHLDLKNLGDQPLRVVIRARAPIPSELEQSALPIPDLSWIRIRPSHLMLDPQESAYADVIITVPKGNQYRRKTYQVMIWSQANFLEEAGGVRMNPALLSRLRFTTRP